jgi:excinuclease ABC subunit A
VLLYGKSIHDVLELTVSEAIQFFAMIGESEKIGDRLDVLDEVGLGYMRLGQPLNTLSGGESQRLKLVAHLGEHGARRTATPRAESFSSSTSRRPGCTSTTSRCS